MLECYDCGERFEEDEVEKRPENVGEFWGSPAYMNIDVCPYCGSEEVFEVEEEDEDDDE